MKVTYKNKKLEAICENYSKAVKAYGEDIASKIHLRIDQIKSSESVEFMMAYSVGRCHKLKHDRAGTYAVDLTHPHRLVFKVNEDEIRLPNLLWIIFKFR